MPTPDKIVGPTWQDGHGPEAIPLTAINSANSELIASRRRSSRLTWTGILTCLFIFLLTAGPATALISWVFARRFDGHQEYQVSPFDTLGKGAFTLDEDSKEANAGTSQTTATLRALTISSFANQLVSIANSFAMGLVAFRAAGRWVSVSEGRDSSDGNPTPAQYGLLVSLLGSSSYSAIARASKYSARRNRSALPRMFIEALSFSCFIFLLSHAVGLSDLWLHSTAKSILVPVSASANLPGGQNLGVAFNQTACDVGDLHVEGQPCLHTAAGWATSNTDSNDNIKNPGLWASYNLSKAVFQAVTLAGANDTAVVLPSLLPSNQLSSSFGYSFTIPTFGSRAECTLLNQLCCEGCHLVTNCSAAGHPQLPLNSAANMTFNRTQDLPSLMFTVIDGSVGTFNADWTENPYSDNLRERDLTFFQEFPVGTLPPNPVTLLIQLQTSMQGAMLANFPVELTPFTDVNNMFYAACNLEFMNVTVTYDPLTASWSLTSSIPSSPSFTAAMMDPLISNYATNRLSSNIQGFMYQDDADSLRALLEQELARQAVVWPSGAFELTTALDISQVKLLALGSYPMAPVIVIVALLYTYALLALWIYLTSSSFPSYDITLSAPSGSGKSPNQTAIALGQRWLTDPLASVGFALAEGGEKDTERSIANNSVDMAVDMEGDRLTLGIHSNRSGETVFGVKKQRLPPKEV